MRIIITNDDGVILDIVEDNEIGDLAKPLAVAELVERIKRFSTQAKE